MFPNITIDGFLYRLLDGASSYNFEDELTLHLSYMLANKPKPDKGGGWRLSTCRSLT